MEPSQPSKPPAASWTTQYEGRLPCDDRRKERTGTYYMALELLLSKRTVHGVRHDLQSFYWVLMWLVLRHTKHSLAADYCYKLFRTGDDFTAAAAKMCSSSEFSVTDNAPLTALIEDFRALLSRTRFEHRAPPPVPLAYDSVLGIFCKAVADPAQWPENDFVRCALTLPENIVEDSIVSAQCDEIATESEEDEYDGVVNVDMPPHKDNGRHDTDAAGQPADSPGDNVPVMYSAPTAEYPAAAAASVCDANPHNSRE
ncbi:hypothetical protein K466DRAFT_658248 [Polyporus arcularius HHB13444]|uniref:Fungal-type protein kinase domain-containing protein n=1 Tax=Polyporus arcularius HHB13444 TaxID=1314778 RepID=A0A5C3PVC6_9APHY|nr:hypothetical protein K466DRAFT_658248 [Polyporus arcularius HHB13444]